MVTCFFSWHLRSGSWVLTVLCLIVHTLPQLHMCAVIFSPLSFLCLLLLKETLVQVQALPVRVSGPSLSPLCCPAVTLPLMILSSWVTMSTLFSSPRIYAKFFNFMFLVLAVLGLCCCVRAFSSCSRWGLLSTVVLGLPLPGVSHCRPQDSAAWAQQFWHMGFVAPRHMGSSWTRDRTGVPCIARQILYLWTTREAPNLCKFNRISNRSKSNITQSPLSLKRQLRKSWLTDLVKRD